MRIERKVGAVEPAYTEVQDARKESRTVVGRDGDAARRDRFEHLVANPNERGDHRGR